MLANLIFLSALVLLSPFILYRRLRHGRYQRGIGQKLFGISASDSIRLLGGLRDTQSIWIHAVSVGEVNLIGDIADRLRRQYPTLPVIISTSTDTGYDLACSKFGRDHVFFCPLDFTWAVRRTLKLLNPKVLVLAELELWPNLIRTARSMEADVVVINGRLSDRSARGYQRFGFLTQPIFAALSQVHCQDEASQQNFIACGASPSVTTVTGSLKFDNAPESREAAPIQSRARWAGVSPWQTVWVVGSTQAGEEAMALSIYKELSAKNPELRLILVPRHAERFEQVAKEIENASFVAHRRSTDAAMPHLSWPSDRVLLIDTIGELRHWWGVGQIATVGGSFVDRGGQNMLEPAGYGSAVSFGPDTRNFADIARRLLDAGGAVRVADAAELKEFVERCLHDVPAADSLGRAAKQLIRQHRGATERTIQGITHLIQNEMILDRRAA